MLINLKTGSIGVYLQGGGVGRVVDTVKGDSFQNFIAGGWDLCQGNKLGIQSTISVFTKLHTVKFRK